MRLRRLDGWFAVGAALLALRFVPAWWCGRQATAWYDGDAELRESLASELTAFETRQAMQAHLPSKNRFVGEWALVTHQMTALGLAQLCLGAREHTESPRSAGATTTGCTQATEVTRAALASFEGANRDFGTHAWGEDALAALGSAHGHAYLAYPALALGMARLVDPSFPPPVAAVHDRVIAALARRLEASKTGLIDTYPGEAFPTDVAAVAAAIAVHGRATGTDHRLTLEGWVKRVRSLQRHSSGLVWQRMDSLTGHPLDAPRGSGTGLAAYFAGFVDRALARELTDALLEHERTLLGFGAIAEYAAGYDGAGDVDSGPVILGVSVAATGFALAVAHAHRREAAFTELYRTTELFGVLHRDSSRARFVTGGPIGNALLLAMLTSGPELAP